MTALTQFTSFDNVDWTSAANSATNIDRTIAGSTSLNLSGTSGQIQHAYLYWSGINGGGRFVSNQNITFNGNNISGELVGTDVDTAWGANNTLSYRADVTSYVSGNGTFNLKGLGSGASGASLIVVYDDGNTSNDRDIRILNGADSNFNDFSWSVNLGNIQYKSGAVKVTLGVADGQMNSADNPVLSNGVAVSGNNTFDGSSGPLWDNDTVDITKILVSGNNSVVITNNAASDALALVYAVLDTPVNNVAPTASAVTLTPIAEDSGARTITKAEILAGANDPDSSLTITAFSLTSGNGTLVTNSDGSYTYTPALNDDTSASFSYTVSDGTSTASSTASLDITPVNDAPTASGLMQSITLAEDAAATNLFAGAVSVADIDSAGITATLTLTSIFAGVLTGAGSGIIRAGATSIIYSITGTPAEVQTQLAGVKFDSADNYNGSTSVTVAISDGNPDGTTGTQPSGSVAITVTEVEPL